MNTALILCFSFGLSHSPPLISLLSLSPSSRSPPLILPLSFGRDLTLNLKFAEIQAAAAEREAAKLQKELDALIEELTDWKDKYQEICVELEQTFNEMAGY